MRKTAIVSFTFLAGLILFGATQALQRRPASELPPVIDSQAVAESGIEKGFWSPHPRFAE